MIRNEIWRIIMFIAFGIIMMILIVVLSFILIPISILAFRYFTRIEKYLEKEIDVEEERFLRMNSEEDCYDEQN
jgi:hypothetical protein